LGDRQAYEPLTMHDKVTVILYRAGIVFSTLGMVFLAVFSMTTPEGWMGGINARGLSNGLLYLLVGTIGLSVVFIHLYVSRFHRFLKRLYLVGLAGMLVLALVGKGDLMGAFEKHQYAPLLLLPLTGCLGFVTAKEAFCFQLHEGYLLALLMPALIVAASVGLLAGPAVSGSLGLVAVLLVVFTLRKVFMPLHYDIGDKSAYQ